MSQRDFGPFRFTLEPQHAQVTVRLSYAGSLLWQGSFSPVSATCEFDAGRNGATARGTLIALFDASGDGGQVQGRDLALHAASFETTFTGTIATW